ncbi:hypothetical protein LSAT2_001911 [Lamellibrachia satsuma]|nr:hypothetical protein LSAT2_001911 [Lamellibrachia satsuma]
MHVDAIDTCSSVEERYCYTKPVLTFKIASLHSQTLVSATIMRQHISFPILIRHLRVKRSIRSNKDQFATQLRSAAKDLRLTEAIGHYIPRILKGIWMSTEAMTMFASRLVICLLLFPVVIKSHIKKSGAALTNMALGGMASQSSTHGHYAAARAIDGNTNGDMFKQSCTHTKQTDDPWWKVTFKYMILARDVLIVNRDECCGKRLNNFSIMVGPYRGKYQKCGSSKNSMISERRKSFTCADNAMGSTLKITNHGKNKVLSLCEVLVYGTALANLALGGIASQSSTHGHYAAARAIDGNTNGDMFKKSCTHTKQTDDPWWKVTFKYMTLAHEVLIVNRDECCGKRLNNFSILIDPYRGKYQKCGSSKNSMISEKTKSFKCADNAKGSTLKITNHGKNKVLSLCEVSVYGTDAGVDSTNMVGQGYDGAAATSGKKNGVQKHARDTTPTPRHMS